MDQSLLIETGAVLASRTVASARLAVFLLDVIPLGAIGVVVIHLAVRFECHAFVFICFTSFPQS
jgi:hypothetical protein